MQQKTRALNCNRNRGNDDVWFGMNDGGGGYLHRIWSLGSLLLYGPWRREGLIEHQLFNQRSS